MLQTTDLATLSQSPLFTDIALEASLLHGSAIIDVAKHEIFATPKQTVDALYVVLSGHLAAHSGTEKSNNSDTSSAPATTELSPGDCLSAQAFIQARADSLHVIAATPCRVLAIPREKFWQMLAQSAQLASNLMHLMGGRDIPKKLEVVTKAVDHHTHGMNHIPDIRTDLRLSKPSLSRTAPSVAIEDAQVAAA